jgi:hypothetical protein
VAVRGGRVEGLREGEALDALQLGRNQLIRAVLNPFWSGGGGWTAVGGVVLEAAILGRVVRGRDDDAIGLRLACVLFVVRENGVRERGRGRVSGDVRYGVIASVDDGVDAVGGEHFEGSDEGRLGESVGILREEERAGGLLRRAVLDDGLRNGEDVRVVEAAVERGAAMPGGAEADALGGVLGVRMVRVEGGDERGQLHELVRGGEVAGRVEQRVRHEEKDRTSG